MGQSQRLVRRKHVARGSWHAGPPDDVPSGFCQRQHFLGDPGQAAFTPALPGPEDMSRHCRRTEPGGCEQPTLTNPWLLSLLVIFIPSRRAGMRSRDRRVESGGLGAPGAHVPGGRHHRLSVWENIRCPETRACLGRGRHPSPGTRCVWPWGCRGRRPSGASGGRDSWRR